MGKIDNCLVGVHAAFCHGTEACLLGLRRYLPLAWAEDPQRCDVVGIPEAHQRHRTQQELAVELIAQARADGAQFAWVLADGGYGHDLKFCQALDEELHVGFIVGVQKTQRIYLHDPEPAIPEGRSGPRRAPIRLQAQTRPTTVQKWAIWVCN